MTPDEEQIEVGSDNIFRDLGFDDREAEELMAKATCIRRIERIKQLRGWTQEELGKAIGMKQSEVSLLLRGKISRFSLERLLLALNALGIGIRITLHDDSEARFVLDDRVDA